MPELIKFSALQPEYFSNEKTWLDFLDSLALVIQEQIREPIGEIEDIRHIIETTDAKIISNTIKQLGFDLPADLIAHNTERLARSVYILSLIHELSGTDKFVDGVRYVLGRDVLVTNLYTNNYVDFYEQPYGPMLVDGGDWYLTTHIKLGMEIVPTDVNVILPENKTLADRLMDAYFEFAPINHVVHDFYYIVKSNITIGIAGCVIVDKIDFLEIGLNYPIDSVQILAPKTVVAGETFKVLADVRFSRDVIEPIGFPVYGNRTTNITHGTHIDELSQSISDTNSPTIEINIGPDEYCFFAYPVALGLATFVDTVLNIAGGWDGASWPDDGSIGNTFGPIVIAKDGVDYYVYRTDFSGIGSASFRVTFQAITPEGYSLTQSYVLENKELMRIQPVVTTDRPDLVFIHPGGHITFALVSVDTIVHLTTFYEGVTNTVELLLKAKEPNLYAIDVDGPTTINGGSHFSITVQGYYENGSVRQLDNAAIRVLSPFVYRETTNSYQFSSDNPTKDQVVYIQATVLQYDMEYTSVHPVIVKHIDLNLYVTNLQIIGDDFITEGETKTYRANATYSNGLSEDVLVLWETSSPGLYADQVGNVTATYPDSDFTAYIKITYQFNRKIYTDSKMVAVNRNIIEPVGLSITGPDRVVELSQSQYSAFIKWSNNAVTQAVAKWSSDKFSMTEDGWLVVGSVGSTPATVVISARINEMIATKNIAVFDTPIEIQYIEIVGPENLKEGDIGQYTAYAHFTDDKAFVVNVIWSIHHHYEDSQIVAGTDTSDRTDEEWEDYLSSYEQPPIHEFPITIDEEGRLSFSGPTVSLAGIKAVYTDARGISYEQTKLVVLVPSVSLISGLIINGESEVLENQRLTLTATAIYEDGSTETVYPKWSVRSADPMNIPEAMADIVSPGIIQGRSVDTDTVVVVVAKYFKETAEFPIIVKNYNPPGSDAPISYRIKGPSALMANKVGSYSLMCVFNNDCGQEIALSNDWSLIWPCQESTETEVDDSGEIPCSPVLSSIATIDDNGFLRSVDGIDHVITVVADWGCCGHEIHVEKEVRIISEPSTLGTLLIYGPERVQDNSHSQYRVELFRISQPAVYGTGEPLSGDMKVSWSLDTIHSEVFLDESGLMYVGTIAEETELVIRATLTEGFYSIEASMVVNVGKTRPVYGKGPINITTDNAITDYLSSVVDLGENDTSFEVNLTLSSDEYGYVAVPVSFGSLTFIQSSIAVEGGWDGASWTEPNVIGASMGPIVITRILNNVASDWYLYRTDFGGLGTIAYTVNF